MKIRILLTVILLALAFSGKSQTYPKNYFTLPVDPPLMLSGGFGEIRENHFHTGIDLLTAEEQEGMPVMAAAEGYISRIKIAPDGYGKALYITHPNGYVTVYGHLQKFTSKLNDYVRNFQNQKQKYEFEDNPGPGTFPVKQGEVIGYSGNTGSSTGVHLHFEIRDEVTEEPINPLLFGFELKDDLPPVVEKIRIYPLRGKGKLEEADTAVTYDLIPSGVNNFTLNTDVDPQVYGTLGFGFSAFDYQVMDEDSSPYELAIYSAELMVDGVPTYSWHMDRLNFDTNRDVNAHIDYLSKIRDALQFERLFNLPGNRLKIYGDPGQTGFVSFTDGASHDIKIELRDFSGNKTEVNFKVRSSLLLKETPTVSLPANAIEVNRTAGLNFKKPKLEVTIPENALYEDAYFEYAANYGSGYLSDIFRVGDFYEALRAPITISIKPSVKIEDALKEKTLIVYTDYYGRSSSCGGQWKDDFITAPCMNFGYYAVAYDTTPPVVEKYYTPADMNFMYGGAVKIKIKDELSKIKSYSGKIDGQWYLFEYDLKEDMITANVDPFMGNADHTLEITVTDDKDNTTVWKSTFYY